MARLRLTHILALGYDPTGHALDVKVTLCTGPGLAVECISKTLDATPWSCAEATLKNHRGGSWPPL